MCSVTRFLQHCARGIEPASVEWAGLQYAMFSARALHEGMHTQSVPLQVWESTYCSVTRFPQHCSRGIEPASVELAGL